jgi:uncharacterized protein (TIGR00266 family)
MTQWYLSFDGQQSGPMNLEQARNKAATNSDGHAWREGFTGWLPIAEVAELRHPSPAASLPERGASAAPRPTRANEVNYIVRGQEMQFVEIELDPGESAVAEAGAMMYKNPAIEMETIFGDSSRGLPDSGFMGKLLSAGKRLLTGETLFMTVFTHAGHHGKARVAFAAPYPGHIIPVSLAKIGGRLICQKDSFLCAARGVSIGIHYQRKILTGLFGGEGFVMQKLDGDGMVFVHVGGALVERELAADEVLHVDIGCLVGMQASVGFEVETVGGIKSALFGGEGLFLVTLRGPGHIWLQSLPFSRLAGRMLVSVPRGGGQSRAEGSILGGWFSGNR